jgi:hypothetical protein
MLLFAVPILVRHRPASLAAASSSADQPDRGSCRPVRGRADRPDDWLMWSLPVILAAWAAVTVLVDLVV